MRPRLRLPALAALALLALTACGPAATTGSATSRPLARAVTAPQPARVTKVLTVVLENHGSTAALRAMPHLAALATRYGRTTHYRALTHPSLPNYLALAGGTTAGVRDDGSPGSHPLAGPSVFDLALRAHRTATTYAEGMPRPCSRTSASRYAARHNPWTYRADPASRQACLTHDVPAGTLSSGALHRDVAAGTLPAVGLVVPDLCNDGHDCPLVTADAWLAGWTAQVMAGPDWRAGRLALAVTFDEDEAHGGDNSVLTVVAAPALQHAVVDQPLTHLSWTRWMADLVGVTAPGDAAAAPSLGKAFGL